MNKYIKPTSNLIDINTEQFMTVDVMSQIVLPFNPGYNNDIIYDGEGVLGNEIKVWDTLENNLH